jgi:hypothetical protein
MTSSTATAYAALTHNSFAVTVARKPYLFVSAFRLRINLTSVLSKGRLMSIDETKKNVFLQ